MKIKDRQLLKQIGEPLYSRPGKTSMLAVSQLWKPLEPRNDQFRGRLKSMSEERITSYPQKQGGKKKVKKSERENEKILRLAREHSVGSKEKSPVVGQYYPNFKAVEGYVYDSISLL